MNKTLLPIVVDLETSGLSMEKCGIWQIGAIDLNTKEEFLQDSRIDDEDEINENSLKVTGKTEDELRNPKEQSQKEMLEIFFRWIEKRKFRIFLCQNPQFDIGFLWVKADKYNLKRTFQYRAFDTHTIAQIKYFDTYNKFFIKQSKDANSYESNMNLSNVLKFCGIPDERIELKGREVVHDGKPHNALEDCKLTAECFYRLMFGENLFPEYSQHEIPEVLIK
ncbi:MAG: 3'-5' exonuclease [Nanoarchaeota archaeon]